MNTAETELLTAFEIHSPNRIRAVLEDGFDISSTLNGQRPINALIEMYLRSHRFPACLRLLLERGAPLDDPKLAPVLPDDPEALSAAVQSDPSLLWHRTTMVCAFTPLAGASLLHVAAEYGHLKVARKLIELGADVDARADHDSVGFGGQTPLFHTVNLAPGNTRKQYVRTRTRLQKEPHQRFGTVLIRGTWSGRPSAST